MLVAGNGGGEGTCAWSWLCLSTDVFDVIILTSSSLSVIMFIEWTGSRETGDI